MDVHHNQPFSSTGYCDVQYFGVYDGYDEHGYGHINYSCNRGNAELGPVIRVEICGGCYKADLQHFKHKKMFLL